MNESFIMNSLTSKKTDIDPVDQDLELTPHLKIFYVMLCLIGFNAVLILFSGS